jgi:hypothetical protein
MARALRHIAIALIAIALTALCLTPAAATAADDEVPRGLRFDETAVTTADKLKAGVSVTVLNDTAKPLLARLRLSDLGLKSRATPAGDVSTAATVLFPAQAVDVPAAGESTVRLRAPDLDVADGTYKGRLSVFDERTDSVARIPFTLQVSESEASATPAVESLNGHATLLFDPSGAETTVELPLDIRKGKPAIEKGAPAGVLSGDDGGFAEVSFADGEVRSVNSAVAETDLKVDGFEGPGTYKGKLNLTPDAAGGEVSVTVEAEHWWLWPAIALLVGIILALWARRLKALRPGLVLLADQTKVDQAYEQARRAFQTAAKNKPWAGYDTKKAFEQESRDVRDAFEALVDESFDEIDEDRKVRLLARVDRLESHAVTLTALASALAALEESLGRVAELAPIDGVAGAAVPPAFASTAHALLEGGEVNSLDELDTLSARVHETIEAADGWPLLHAEARRAAGRISAAEARVSAGGDEAAFVTQARRKLVGFWLLLSETPQPAQITQGPLVDGFREATLMAAEATALRAAQAAPPKPLGRVARDQAAADARELLRLPWFGGVSGLPAASRARLREIRRRLRVADRVQILFAGAVALYTGLVALYWGKTFGTPQDYVSALLWGSVTAGALDALVEAIRTRVAGATGGGV